MNSSKQIKVGAIISYIAIFINIISGLIYTPWMMNTIGKSDYGLYTLAMSLINTFLIDFGLSMSVQRFLAKYIAANDQEGANNVVGLVFKIYVVLTTILLCIFIFLWFFIDKIYIELTANEIEKFRVLYVVAVIYSIMSFPFIPLNGMFSAYEKFVQLKLCELFHKIISVIFTVFALLQGYGVFSIVVVNLLTCVIYIVLRLWLLKKCTIIKPNFRYKDNSLLRELFSFSIWSSISTLVIRLFLTLGPQILGVVSGSGQIAVFGYAVSLETYIYTFVTAINGFFMTRISREANKCDESKREKIVDLMTGVGRLILILFGIIFIGFVLLGKEFISLLFGVEYIDSYYCTLLICAYGIIAYPQQIANTYMMVENKMKKKAISAIICLVIDIVLSVLFGLFWGAIGVSLAICISLFIYTIFMNILYVKDLKLNIAKFFINCHLKLLPALLISFLLSYGITLIPIFGWLGFFLKVVIIVCVYILMTYLFMLNKEEKAKLFGQFKLKK